MVEEGDRVLLFHDKSGRYWIEESAIPELGERGILINLQNKSSFLGPTHLEVGDNCRIFKLGDKHFARGIAKVPCAVCKTIGEVGDLVTIFRDGNTVYVYSFDLEETAHSSCTDLEFKDWAVSDYHQKQIGYYAQSEEWGYVIARWNGSRWKTICPNLPSVSDVYFNTSGKVLIKIDSIHYKIGEIEFTTDRSYQHVLFRNDKIFMGGCYPGGGNTTTIYWQVFTTDGELLTTNQGSLNHVVWYWSPFEFEMDKTGDFFSFTWCTHRYTPGGDESYTALFSASGGEKLTEFGPHVGLSRLLASNGGDLVFYAYKWNLWWEGTVYYYDHGPEQLIYVQNKTNWSYISDFGEENYGVGDVVGWNDGIIIRNKSQNKFEKWKLLGVPFGEWQHLNSIDQGGFPNRPINATLDGNWFFCRSGDTIYFSDWTKKKSVNLPNWSEEIGDYR